MISPDAIAPAVAGDGCLLAAAARLLLMVSFCVSLLSLRFNMHLCPRIFVVCLLLTRDKSDLDCGNSYTDSEKSVLHLPPVSVLSDCSDQALSSYQPKAEPVEGKYAAEFDSSWRCCTGDKIDLYC